MIYRAAAVEMPTIIGHKPVTGTFYTQEKRDEDRGLKHSKMHFMANTVSGLNPFH